jgi:hypothetical protein
VRLSVFNAPVDTGPGESLFSEPASLMTGHAQTIAVGGNLHIAVVQAASADPLLSGQIYAYNVTFGTAAVEPFAPTEDLRSLQLLVTRPEKRNARPYVPAHDALGYSNGLLPTFVLPPNDLTGLRIAHGSCRRPHAAIPDLMAALDDQIAAALIKPLERPQQLFLTGDQIYADDVAPAVLHLCNGIGNLMMGSIEQLPITWKPPGTTRSLTLMPADRVHFPAGTRLALMIEDARLSTGDGASHLISLAEYCAMHVLCWSNVLWGPDLPTYDDLYWREPLPLSQFDEVLAGIELPPPIWQLHTGLYEKSKLGLKDRCEDTEDLQTFTATNAGNVLKCIAGNAKLKDAHEKQSAELKSFRDSLTKVRRLMANVATYMIFDDHEVTDDWNLSQIWRDRVMTSPLGKTLLRNGLLGYFLCQGWGNNPRAFEGDVVQPDGTPQPGPGKRLLLTIPRLFPSGDELPPDRAACDEIDLLLGLDGSDPPVKWHYSVDGPRHRALVLDNRTRRAFETRMAPPTNLSPSAIRDQIPDITESPLPAGIEVLFVIAPLPLFGVPLFDELGGPLAQRAHDVKHHRAIGGMPGTNPDAVEAWSNVPPVFEEVLARLAPYRRIVVLSGDVHYAHSAEVSYWTRADTSPSRFAQFTSSAFKNVWPETVVVLNRSFALTSNLLQLFSPLVRLGWFNHEPTPLQIPDDVHALPAVRDAMVRDPLLLPGNGWPEGTTITRQPDWAWMLTLSRDQRPRGSIPAPARPAPLDPANPNADAPESLEGYRQTARRHRLQLDKVTHTRTILFASSFGIVTFSRSENGITTKHDFFARPPGASAPAAFTSHSVVLDAADQAMPGIQAET